MHRFEILTFTKPMLGVIQDHLQSCTTKQNVQDK